MYYKLISKSYKINSRSRKFGDVALSDYLASKIANIFIPIFTNGIHKKIFIMLQITQDLKQIQNERKELTLSMQV